ncbi:class I lanthipeptide [Chitinophaga nivalis]|uniref:Class I lanthipeptide n=1 Tax=Chitinophaga nivalis TaxID=2991709 RepID=A0ABT3ILC4_9BACT|nr:class I lanthipeptide [Chitinophaga nivalis]MCW3465546.1 class I lanthipeptide [Chitinophaga nivalis]MCW3484763.1 class I lanthipeptide [Chitinophaga nivalis]
MKKMKFDLNKKLFLNKATVASLSDVMQQQVAGGARVTQDFACGVTINLPRTKLSRQAPRPDCLCCADIDPSVITPTIVPTIAQ